MTNPKWTGMPSYAQQRDLLKLSGPQPGWYFENTPPMSDEATAVSRFREEAGPARGHGAPRPGGGCEARSGSVAQPPLGRLKNGAGNQCGPPPPRKGEVC